jgi:lysophospholipase L1-like esterase
LSVFIGTNLTANPSIAPIISYLLDRDTANNKKIFIIGDSTVRYDFDGDRDIDSELHRVGWGSMLNTFMRYPENVFNRARRGAIAGGIEDNVNSYRRDAAIDAWIAANKGVYDYNNTKAFIQTQDIQNGAFLLIQFGANDKYAGISEADFKSHLQFYVDDARAMGITPILVTPINPKSTLTDTRAPYTDYIRDLAADLNVALIDLHVKSLEIYQQYTTQMRYDIFGAYKLDGSYDTTHLNRQGAKIVASWLKDIACSQIDTKELCQQFVKNRSLLIANAGEDKNITTQETLDLNASGLDSDGDIVSYTWSEAGVELSNNRILQYSSTVLGIHTLTLQIRGSDGASVTDMVDIEVHPPQVRILEDAEDANTDGWGLYATTDGSTVSNIDDVDKGDRVIVLEGNNGLDNGFSFTNLDITDSTIVSWSMKYSENFKFFVKVKTTSNDPLYIYYTPEDISRGYEEINSKKYIHVALGSYAKDDRWIDFTKDIEADLKVIFPDESIENIYGFYVRGSGKIDDIKTLQSAKITKLIYKEDANITTVANVDMNVSIYYQEEQVQKPTIYFVAGGTINHKRYEHLIHFLVNEGYVVVAASYNGSFDSEHISDNYFEAFVKGWQMCEAKGINDDTRVGLVGHSSGAGTLPSLAYKFFVNEAMGENGRFVFGATPWIDFQYSNAMALPKDTNFVTQWYEDDVDTDPRIYLDMYRHVVLNHKTFITLKRNTDHSTIVNGVPLDVVKNTIYESLGNLAKYTFNYTNRELIFPDADIDNENMLILRDNTKVNDSNYTLMLDKFVAAGSPYPCKSDPSFASNPREKECEAYATQDIYPVDTDFSDIPSVSVDIPSYMQSYQEAIFDTNVTKITDRASQTGNFHPYPKQGSAWNSDMTIIRMGYRLYDADTMIEFPLTQTRNNSQAYAILGSPASGAADIRWSKTNPNLMYVLDSSQKYVKVEINSDKNDTTFTTMIDFSSHGYSKVSTGNNEGNLDYDDKYIVFAAKKDANDTVFAMLYELEQADVNWTKTVPHGLWDNDDYFDWISITPLGDSILLSASNHIYLYDINLSNEIVLENEANHGDMGIDINGNPVYVQFIFSGEQGIWSYNLKTAQKLKLLPSKYNGGHITCRNYFHPGWCYINTSQEGHKEVFALKLDNASGTVRRFAQTHVSLQNRECTQVNVSPDGSQILFASDWNSGSVEDYQYDADNYLGCNSEERHVKIDTYKASITW